MNTINKEEEAKEMNEDDMYLDEHSDDTQCCQYNKKLKYLILQVT